MTKAYSYIRFSSPEQAQGDSLRRQISMAEDWAKERGLTLDSSLRDLGVSAFHGANRTSGALKSFLEHVETGEIQEGSYLIVESLDRLSRETVMDATMRLFALIQAGIIVVTLSDRQEYSREKLRSDWTPLIFSLIAMARAHEESRIKSERVGEAWRQKKATARLDGKPITPRCPEWLEVKNGSFITRPERVALIERIFLETIEGFGRREIVRRLNTEGIPPFRGGEGWHTSSIGKIVESRAVLGEYQPHSGTHRNRNRKPEGDPIANFYPPIIDEQIYWRANLATQGRRQAASGRKGVSGAHIFQGIAKCGTCGGPMHIVNKGKPPKGGVYLSCSSNMRSLDCINSRRWRVDRLEMALINAIGMLDFPILGDLDTTGSKIAAKSEALSTKIKDLERRQKQLIELVELEDEAATGRSIEIAKSIKQLKKDLKEADVEIAKSHSSPDLASRVINAAAISRKMGELDEATQEKKELRIRLREAIRGIVLRLDCDVRYGAVVTFTPIRKVRLAVDRTDGRPLPNKFVLREEGLQALIMLDAVDTESLALEAWYSI